MKPYNPYYIRVMSEEVERVKDGSADLEEALEQVRVVMMDADDALTRSAAQELAEEMFERLYGTNGALA